MLDIEIAGATRALTADEAEVRAVTPTIKRLRDSHHAVARFLVAGLHPGQVSLLTGYNISRISTLQRDPTFRELMAFYAQSKEIAERDAEAVARGLGMDALQEMSERLQDAPESISNETLADWAKLGLDRGGLAPIKRSLGVSVTKNVGQRFYEAEARHTPPTIDHEDEAA